MKKVKNYIQSDLAKKKITRYKYWSIKDENGITIVSSEDEGEGQSFGDLLNRIIADNVDAEIQVKYGTNEQSSRQNPPLFIRINEEIEWVDPIADEPDMVTLNGVAHQVDKNGNVNINLATPTTEQPKIESANVDYFRQEMEMQLNGLRQESALKEEKMKVDLQNKLFEQTLTFKDLMLKDREAKIAEREQALAAQEALMENKQNEIQSDLKGYLKQVPNVLGGIIKEFIKNDPKPIGNIKKEDEKSEKEPKTRKKVNFSIEPETIITEVETTNTDKDEDV